MHCGVARGPVVAMVGTVVNVVLIILRYPSSIIVL